MEWITLLAAIAAIAIAADSEARAAKLARRVASLEALCAQRGSDDERS